MARYRSRTLADRLHEQRLAHDIEAEEPDPDHGMCGADLDAEADRVEASWSRWREG